METTNHLIQDKISFKVIHKNLTEIFMIAYQLHTMISINFQNQIYKNMKKENNYVLATEIAKIIVEQIKN